jgi:hypothetical protein
MIRLFAASLAVAAGAAWSPEPSDQPTGEPAPSAPWMSWSASNARERIAEAG